MGINKSRKEEIKRKKKQNIKYLKDLIKRVKNGEVIIDATSIDVERVSVREGYRITRCYTFAMRPYIISKNENCCNSENYNPNIKEN